MPPFFRVSALATALLVTSTARPERAHACEPLVCSPGRVHPLQPSTDEVKGELPANAFEVRWHPSQHFGGGVAPAQSLELGLVEGDSVSAIPTEQTRDAQGVIHVVPTTTLTAGSYVQVAVTGLDCTAPTARGLYTVRVSPAAPTPSALGSLRVESITSSWTLPTGGSECTRRVRAAAPSIALLLSDSARPYADALSFELTLDGKPPIPVELQRFVDQPPDGLSVVGEVPVLYHVCSPDDAGVAGGNALGIHTVQLTGTTPDGTRLRSETVEFELACDAPSRDAGAGGGGSDGSGTAASSDAATATASAADAGSTADAGSASTPDLAVEPTREAPSGCAVTDGPETGALGALLTVLLGVLVGRRRRAPSR